MNCDNCRCDDAADIDETLNVRASRLETILQLVTLASAPKVVFTGDLEDMQQEANRITQMALADASGILADILGVEV